MQRKPDGQYRCICHAVDHISKTHVIFPLVSKEARVVANRIKIHVFSYFGLPRIIHSDNGSEFVNDIIVALVMLWPGKATFINGALGHSQSQGLVEQGNSSIDNFIRKEHKCCWASWLLEIQCKMSNFFDGQYVFERVMEKAPFKCHYCSSKTKGALALVSDHTIKVHKNA